MSAGNIESKYQLIKCHPWRSRFAYARKLIPDDPGADCIGGGARKHFYPNITAAVQKMAKIKQSGWRAWRRAISRRGRTFTAVRTMLFARRHNSEFLVDKAAQPPRRINFATRKPGSAARIRARYILSRHRVHARHGSAIFHEGEARGTR